MIDGKLIVDNFAGAVPLREKKEYADREGVDRTASLCIRRGIKECTTF